jgi:hypothetical protein
MRVSVQITSRARYAHRTYTPRYRTDIPRRLCNGDGNPHPGATQGLRAIAGPKVDSRISSVIRLVYPRVAHQLVPSFYVFNNVVTLSATGVVSGTEQLAEELKAVERFSAEEVRLLPRILQAPIRRCRKQSASSVVRG